MKECQYVYIYTPGFLQKVNYTLGWHVYVSCDLLYMYHVIYYTCLLSDDENNITFRDNNYIHKMRQSIL